ncbi:hypothetical protein HZB89_00040, partial [archaeon]|nr:hypothetical protein [archaeon]
MNLKDLLSKGILFFYVFAATAIIVSFNLGYFWLNSIAIAVVSAIITFFLIKKFKPAIEVPLPVFALGLLMFLAIGFPVLFMNQFYDAQADAAQAIILRTLSINEKIPLTFEPYAGLSFSYQFGMQLFAKIFNDLLPVMPDYLWLWLLGAFFGAMQLVLIYAVSKSYFKSEKAGLISAVLFFGAKAVYRDLMIGSYAMLLALNFFLLAFYFFEKKNKIKYLFVPAAFAVHPGIGLVSMALFFIVYAGIFKEKIKEVLMLLPSLALIVPSLWFNLLPLAAGMLASKSAAASTGGIMALLKAIALTPLWFGLVPAAGLLVGIIWLAKEKKFS